MTFQIHLICSPGLSASLDVSKPGRIPCGLLHDTWQVRSAGSDSEVYDTEGRFVPEKFEELFTKYDRRNRNGLDFNEMWEMSEANRNVLDPTGWTAEKMEWWATWFIAGDKNVSSSLFCSNRSRL